MLGGMWHNIDESANLYSHIGNQYVRFIENDIKGINQSQDSVMLLFIIYSKNAESYHKYVYSAMFLSALFVIAD